MPIALWARFSRSVGAGLVDDESIFKPHNLYYVKRRIGLKSAVALAISLCLRTAQPWCLQDCFTYAELQPFPVSRLFSQPTFPDWLLNNQPRDH